MSPFEMIVNHMFLTKFKKAFVFHLISLLEIKINTKSFVRNQVLKEEPTHNTRTKQIDYY